MNKFHLCFYFKIYSTCYNETEDMNIFQVFWEATDSKSYLLHNYLKNSVGMIMHPQKFASNETS